jgi:hypothetical protein
MPAALPAPPLTGSFWSLVVPAALLVVSVAATWLLYRHFARSASPVTSPPPRTRGTEPE